MAEPAGPARTREPWGLLADGTAVDLVTLRSPAGAVARLTSWGASLVSLDVPGGRDRSTRVVLGLPSAAAYASSPLHFGGTVGRYANRIREGRFELDGRAVQVAREDTHHLHGGPRGFSRRPWTTEAWHDGDADRAVVRFTLDSPDGDAGFPGRLGVEAEYRLDGCALTVAYRARTDAPTHVNLTNHAYFNLGGGGSVLDHELCIAAPEVLAVDAHRMVTGERLAVEGTPFDLRTPRPLRSLVEGRHPQLETAGGVDHSWLLPEWTPVSDRRGGPSAPLREAALMRDPATGLVMRLATTLPAVHVWIPEGLGEAAAEAGTSSDFGAVCLETQFPADAPNRPDLPSTRLDPGEVWHHETRFAFETE